MQRSSIRAAALLVLLLLAPVPGRSFSTRIDTTLVMSDGVELALTYFVPSASPGPRGRPAVIIMHGFDVQGVAKGAFIDDGEAAPMRADSGYFAVAFSARGMGVGPNRSDGVFDWFIGARELADLREVVAWVGARPDVDSERIALEGISQGGLMAWGAAIAHMPVRCIVPMVSAPGIADAFVGNGGFRYLIRTFLAAAAMLPQNIRLGGFLRDTLQPAIYADRHDQARALIAPRDMAGREAEVEIPVFIQGAWHDDIFQGDELLRSFQALRSPKKLLMWPGPHLWTPEPFRPIRDRLTYRFYRRWLRDDEAETIMDPDSALALIDGATGELRYAGLDEAHRWLPRTDSGAPALRLNIASGAALEPTPPGEPVVEARGYRKNISDDSIAFRSAPLPADETFIGAAVHLVVNSDGSTYQANTLLWDFDPATGERAPIMRGCFQVRDNEATVRETLDYALDPQLYTVAAGHQIEAWVKFGTNTIAQVYGIPFKPDDEFGSALFPPQESANDTLFSSAAAPSTVTLYRFVTPPASVVENAAASSALSATPAIARGGEPVVVRFAGRAPVRLDLVTLDARLVATWSIEPGAERITIATGGLATGVYLLRSGPASIRIAVVH